VITEIKRLQSLIVPFNIEQTVNVDPIGDYTIKDEINVFNLNSKGGS
jgi:hypothetical protein